MLYELRVYTVVPGRMPALLARFKDHTTSIWKKHGIVQVGFWTTLIGNSNAELTYILSWTSLADREAKWTAFQSDPEWLRVREESEKDGPIVASIANQLLTPTSFSALA
ncbi:NIPSNAP family protein [Methyloferula stellata]|uniref:NIPSNAP family protein n=1 Tax=Methyloferula stellata TaxID=876270 RepID=UPI00036010F0|nr:NIPSNAP family protein [Methyloferula stellata]